MVAMPPLIETWTPLYDTGTKVMYTLQLNEVFTSPINMEKITIPKMPVISEHGNAVHARMKQLYKYKQKHSRARPESLFI